MRYSRLRLRLAGWFALAMLLGLAFLDLGLYARLRHRAETRLGDQVSSAARELRIAVQREAAEVPPPTLAKAVQDALDEFPAGPDALLVLAEDGTPVGHRGAAGLLAAASGLTTLPGPGKSLDVPIDEEGAARVAADRSSGGAAAFTVVAIRSTAAVQEDLETLAGWLVLSIPLVLLVSLPAGYFLARRALAPFGSLAAQLEGMNPQALDRRLPVGTPPDELDRVADQVNRLLDRLAGAQAQTRRFLAQAAHQLRTPLTLIRGESDLAIERPRSPEDYRASLGRVSRAAGQMSHRVDDLLLLARAEAGERVSRTERVELDAVALEAADLMRGRAQALGHHLALGQMEGLEVVGDEGLLREAAVELLENACRHGTTDAPVRIAVRGTDGMARLEVASAGQPAQQSSEAAGERLGLTIVRWIATAHGGRLEQAHYGNTNFFSLALPAAGVQGGD
jgi:signal transduction histidine kinase